jgi:glycosyltransferase involved in cell wall biosynthesis
MDSADLISVIIPVFNGEKYLPACLNTLKAQTYKNIEFIFVDDGSTDNSYSLIKEYAKEDKRVRAIQTPHGGISTARNAGIKASKGSFLGFCDCDDVIEPTMYEELHDKLMEHPETSVAISPLFQERVDAKHTGVYPSIDYLKGILLYLASASVCDALFRKDEVFSSSSFLSGLFCEDVVFWMEYLPKVKNVYFYSKVLYHVEEHCSSTSHKCNSVSIVDMPLVRPYIKKAISEFGIDLSDYEKYFYARQSKIYFTRLPRKIMKKSNKSYMEMLMSLRSIVPYIKHSSRFTKKERRQLLMIARFPKTVRSLATLRRVLLYRRAF